MGARNGLALVLFWVVRGHSPERNAATIGASRMLMALAEPMVFLQASRFAPNSFQKDSVPSQPWFETAASLRLRSGFDQPPISRDDGLNQLAGITANLPAETYRYKISPIQNVNCAAGCSASTRTGTAHNDIRPLTI